MAKELRRRVRSRQLEELVGIQNTFLRKAGKQAIMIDADSLNKDLDQVGWLMSSRQIQKIVHRATNGQVVVTTKMARKIYREHQSEKRAGSTRCLGRILFGNSGRRIGRLVKSKLAKKETFHQVIECKFLVGFNEYVENCLFKMADGRLTNPAAVMMNVDQRAEDVREKLKTTDVYTRKNILQPLKETQKYLRQLLDNVEKGKEKPADAYAKFRIKSMPIIRAINDRYDAKGCVRETYDEIYGNGGTQAKPSAREQKECRLGM